MIDITSDGENMTMKTVLRCFYLDEIEKNPDRIGRSIFAREAWEEGFRQGFLQGFQQGFLKSIPEDMHLTPQSVLAEAMLALFQPMLPAVPEWLTETLSAADMPTLELWSQRVLKAKTLEDVFTG